MVTRPVSQTTVASLKRNVNNDRVWSGFELGCFVRRSFSSRWRWTSSTSEFFSAKQILMIFITQVLFRWDEMLIRAKSFLFEAIEEVEEAWARARRSGPNFCLTVIKSQVWCLTSPNFRKAWSRLRLVPPLGYLCRSKFRLFRNESLIMKWVCCVTCWQELEKNQLSSMWASFIRLNHPLLLAPKCFLTSIYYHRTAFKPHSNIN